MDYERGLRELKKRAQGEEWYRDILPYEAALHDRLHDERLYGVAPQSHQELMRVVGQLNHLALEKIGISFNDLCRGESQGNAVRTDEPQEGGRVGGEEREMPEEGVVSIFYCYASVDKKFCLELEKQLVVMRRQKLLKSWYRQDIQAGEREQENVQKALTAAQIILLMVSPDLLASEELYEKQIKPTYARWKQKAVRVLPIILRPTEGWEETEFGGLVSLPREKGPVSAWVRQEDAFYTIAREIRIVVQEVKKEMEGSPGSRMHISTENG